MKIAEITKIIIIKNNFCCNKATNINLKSVNGDMQ